FEHHLTLNQRVQGSSPCAPTNTIKCLRHRAANQRLLVSALCPKARGRLAISEGRLDPDASGCLHLGRGKKHWSGCDQTWCGPGVGSGRQSGLRKTVDDPQYILLSFERQPAEMLAERVFRIDLHEFAPDASGLVDLAEMAKGGRKRGAGKIRSGHEANAFPEMSCRCFVLAGQQVCRAQEVEVLLTLSRVQTHGPFDHWNCFQRLSREAA